MHQQPAGGKGWRARGGGGGGKNNKDKGKNNKNNKGNGKNNKNNNNKGNGKNNNKGTNTNNSNGPDQNANNSNTEPKERYNPEERDDPEARVRKDVAVIMQMLNKQDSKKYRGLLVMIPSSVSLISNCAMNLLLPNKAAEKATNEATHSVPTYKGWILVTTHENYDNWMLYKKRCSRIDATYYKAPVFTLLTYETIGMLQAVAGDDSNKSKYENTLLIFEHAENLIDILHKRPQISDYIRFFNKTLYFTNNIELGDFHMLFKLIDDTDESFPKSTAEVREQHEQQITSFPRAVNKLVLEPSTRMMMQFVFILCIVMNAKRVFNRNSEHDARSHYDGRFTRRRSVRRFAPRLPTLRRARKQTREHGLRGQQNSRRHRRRHGGVHTRSLHKRGGFLFLMPGLLTTSLMSGTFLFWLFSKNLSVAGTVANLLSFVFMLVPNIIKGISIFLSRNSPAMEEACANAYWNLASVVEGVDKFLHSSATRSGFIHIWRTVETIIMGFSKSILRLEEKDRGIIMAFFGFMCLAWMASKMIHRFVYPKYEDSLIIRNASLKDNPVQMMVAVSCEKNIRHRDWSPFRNIKKRTVYYTTADFKEIIQGTKDLQKLSSPYAKEKTLTEILNVGIDDKYNSCKRKYNIKEKDKKRILVIVPDDALQSVNWAKSRWNKDQCIVEISVKTIIAMRRDEKPKWDSTRSQIKYAAHEIHFITPPNNYQRQVVVTAFAGILNRSDVEFLRGPFGLKVARERSNQYTKLYEYIRPFNWFVWLTEIGQPSEVTTATTKNNPNKKKSTTIQSLKNVNKRGASTSHWLTTAISGIQSPEEMVMKRRKNLSHDCEQVRRILCKHKEGSADFRLVSLEGESAEDGSIDGLSGTRKTINTHHVDLKKLFQKHFEDKAESDRSTDYTNLKKELKKMEKEFNI